MAAFKAGLRKPRSDINQKEPVDEVIVLVHSKIHDSLINACGLKLPD